MKNYYWKTIIPALLILIWILPISVYAQQGFLNRSDEAMDSSSGWDQRKRISSMLTVLRNQYDLLPVLDIEKRKMLLLSLGTENPTDFDSSISRYTTLPAMHVPFEADTSRIHEMSRAIAGKNLVIVSLHKLDTWQQLPEKPALCGTALSIA